MVDQPNVSSRGGGIGWMLLYFGVLYLLTLLAIKVPLGIEMRIAQLFLVAGFSFLLLYDLLHGKVRWDILLVMVGMGLLLSEISRLSPYLRPTQHIFIIKYIVIYPAAFYFGYRLLERLTVAQAVKVLETTLLAGCMGSIFLHYYPISFLIHERPAYLSVALKGSFWEQGDFAFFVGLFLLTAFALRLKHAWWPRRNKFYLYALYGLALACALASRNKAIWLALGAALLTAGFLNPRLPIATKWLWERFKKQPSLCPEPAPVGVRLNTETRVKVAPPPARAPVTVSENRPNTSIRLVPWPRPNLLPANWTNHPQAQDYTQSVNLETATKRRPLKRWGLRLLLILTFMVVVLSLYNASLEDDQKIVTMAMLEHKWEAERGMQLREAWKLIAAAPWLGRGFGFVEKYFGVGMIFNSYLDVWASVGVLGFVFALGLVIVCFSRRSLVAILVVTYLFIFNNLNPYAQSEYYYIFLGLCYASVRADEVSRQASKGSPT